MADRSPSSDTITFLGTAGARIMVANQILASGGLWLNLSGTEILLDPGPGTIIQSTKRKLGASKLSAIILSHRHLDHSADTNIMVEAMTQGGFKRHGWLFAPTDALGSEPVLFSYLKDYLEGVEILQEGKSYSVGNISFATPVRHIHQVETYGMLFTTTEHTFSYIADSRYFDSLCHSYSGELLVINVVRLEANHPFNHLSVPDAEHIITELKPKVAILTHFGRTMWQAKPWEIASRLSQDTGVKVIAARDGMEFDLSRLNSD
jgi:ribonuclease BN (tRNA processing enzyme)